MTSHTEKDCGYDLPDTFCAQLRLVHNASLVVASHRVALASFASNAFVFGTSFNSFDHDRSSASRALQIFYFFFETNFIRIEQSAQAITKQNTLGIQGSNEQNAYFGLARVGYNLKEKQKKILKEKAKIYKINT